MTITLNGNAAAFKDSTSRLLWLKDVERRALVGPIRFFLLYAFANALSFLESVFNAARAPALSVLQLRSRREQMDGRRLHKLKPMLDTFREKCPGTGESRAATRRRREEAGAVCVCQLGNRKLCI